jgi:hypothetical protein
LTRQPPYNLVHFQHDYIVFTPPTTIATLSDVTNMHHPADHHGIDLEDDCSSESELSDDGENASAVFLKVLKEPYEPPARALGSEQSRSEAGLPNAEDEAHGSGDKGQNEVDDMPQESEDDDKQAYRPHGHWAWTAGMHIERSKVLMHLGSEFSECTADIVPEIVLPISAGTKCSVYLMKGIIDKQEITYISKLSACFMPSASHRSKSSSFQLPHRRDGLVECISTRGL